MKNIDILLTLIIVLCVGVLFSLNSMNNFFYNIDEISDISKYTYVIDDKTNEVICINEEEAVVDCSKVSEDIKNNEAI